MSEIIIKLGTECGKCHKKLEENEACIFTDMGCAHLKNLSLDFRIKQPLAENVKKLLNALEQIKEATVFSCRGPEGTIGGDKVRDNYISKSYKYLASWALEVYHNDYKGSFEDWLIDEEMR